MTLIQIETTDPRDRKALELAATAATWKTTMNSAFLVPSSDGKRTYVTTTDTCSCEDNARGNRCKHRRAAAIYVALREASQPTPVRKPVEASTPIDRHSPELRRILGGPAPYRTRFDKMSEAELFGKL